MIINFYAYTMMAWSVAYFYCHESQTFAGWWGRDLFLNLQCIPGESYIRNGSGNYNAYYIEKLK